MAGNCPILFSDHWNHCNALFYLHVACKNIGWSKRQHSQFVWWAKSTILWTMHHKRSPSNPQNCEIGHVNFFCPHRKCKDGSKWISPLQQNHKLITPFFEQVCLNFVLAPTLATHRLVVTLWFPHHINS
jgi:hypothetical protein